MINTDLLSQHLSEDAIKNIQAWLSEPKYQEYKSELVELIETEQWQALEDSFFKVIEFGTAGRRGTTGLGSNRINKVTIGESTQALCEYARSFDASAPEKGVVIAYDTRLSSPELSEYAARVCAANGFKTYSFETFRSTPELSFAVRHLKAAIGIVISASHNPPLDNGFKAYWSDGGQLAAPHDKGVLDMGQAITDIKVMDFGQAVEAGQIVPIGNDVDEAYITTVTNQAEGEARDVTIVYSPLHGAGQTNVLPVLERAGFTDILLVDDQMIPDGNFPTVENGKPNPEEKPANDRAVALMLAEKADIAITNDPDADRVGIMVRQGDETIYLSGNQTAVLIADYVLGKMQQKGILTPEHFMAKTIVTTDMLEALAKFYNVKLYKNLLIGFKYISKLMTEKRSTNEKFILAAEESYGILKGDYAQDKDGAAGALPISEYAAELKQQGKTLYDRLLELYGQHGMYIEYLASAYFLGASGFEKMQTVMQSLQNSPPKRIGEHTVTAVLNYLSLERKDIATGEVSVVDSVKSNIIAFELNGDPRCRVTIRPSGTEPKIKFYIQWFDEVTDKAQTHQQYQATCSRLEDLAKTLEGLVLN